MNLVNKIFVITISVIILVFGYQAFFPKGSWSCQNGEWKKTGYPLSRMPQSPCGQSTNSKTDIPLENTQKNLEMGISYDLPKQATTRFADGQLIISYLGEDQPTNTELADGYSVSITKASLFGGQTLAQIVTADIEQKEQQLSPDFSLIKKPETFSDQSITFQTSEIFGDVSYYYIPVNSSNYLIVSKVVKDPNSKGYNTQADQIINSLSFLP